MKLNIIEKSILVLVLVVVILGIYFSRTDLQYFDGFYVREDGPVEWVTVVFLLMGSFISLKRFIHFKGKKPFLFLLGTLGLSFLFFFGAGEEISWGQRIFDIKSPDFFRNNNSQMETNIHNLIYEGKKINKIIFGLLLGIAISVYLLILPVLYRKYEWAKNLVLKFAIPLPQLYQILAYIALAILAQFVSSGKKGEILEFGGCVLFFLIILFPVNKKELYS